MARAEIEIANALDLGELADSASFLMRIAQVKLFEEIFAAREGWPLDLTEQTVMTLVAQNPDARQGEVADALMIKWPNMTKIVRGLEERGLIERIVPDDDRRSVLLRLTKEGARLIAPLRGRLQAIERDITSMLPEKERKALIALLLKVIGWEGRDAG